MKIILTFLTILSLNVLVAQNQKLTDIVNYYHSEKNFNGAVIVAANGKIDYLGSLGIGSRQNGSVLNTKSKFKIASMTKVFTAVLIMKLVEQGKLNLENSIGKYLPSYSGDAKNKVNIHHLLTYSSGIENILDGLGMKPYQNYKTLDEFINTYCSGNLVYDPGTKSAYGNTEYILLQKIIENVSGKSFEEFLRNVILEPIGLENTKFLKYNEITSGLVPSYTFNNSLKTFNNDEPYYTEMYFGAGALYSTVEDLLKLDQAIFNSKILNKQFTDKLLTFYPELGYTAYGMWGSTGWGNFSEPFYYRTGGILGSNANWIHTLDTGKSIIVLSNTNATNLYELSEKLYLASIGKDINIPKIELEEKEENENLEALEGIWRIDLRPTPNSEPYIKDFKITKIKGGKFSGVFYGSEFSNGLINNEWDKLYFAFTTKDEKNQYYHSGYILNNTIYGISYCPGREFVSYWEGIKQ